MIGETGPRVPLAPAARPDDRRIDVVLIVRPDRHQLREYLEARLLTRPQPVPRFEVHRCLKAELEPLATRLDARRRRTAGGIELDRHGRQCRRDGRSRRERDPHAAMITSRAPRTPPSIAHARSPGYERWCPRLERLRADERLTHRPEPYPSAITRDPRLGGLGRPRTPASGQSTVWRTRSSVCPGFARGADAEHLGDTPRRPWPLRVLEMGASAARFERGWWLSRVDLVGWTA